MASRALYVASLGIQPNGISPFPSANSRPAIWRAVKLRVGFDACQHQQPAQPADGEELDDLTAADSGKQHERPQRCKTRFRNDAATPNKIVSSANIHERTCAEMHSFGGPLARMRASSRPLHQRALGRIETSTLCTFSLVTVFSVSRGISTRVFTKNI
jgi:hypothetical protein